MSNIQMELLRLYGNNVSDKTLLEIKSLLANYFAERASDKMDELWEKEQMTQQQMTDWTNEHNRSENSFGH